jgi:hypothetical protein
MKFSFLSPSLAALGVFLAAPARADEGRPVEVTIHPKGQDWSIGSHGGGECRPACFLHLVPGKYPMVMGGAKDTLVLSGPVDIAYHPGSKALRYAGLGLALGGLVIGGVLVYELAASCASRPDTTARCGLLTLSPAAQRGIGVFTAVLFSAAVTGGVLFALSGESISVDEATRAAGRPVGLTWRPIVGGFSAAGSGLHGATLDLDVRF